MKVAKHFITSLALSTFLTPALVFADHAEENACSIQRLSYQLADDAKALERQSFYEAQWGNRFPTNASKLSSEIALEAHDHDLDILDHSEDRRYALFRLGRAARSVHLAASDLYRTARRICYYSGGRTLNSNFTTLDHDDGDLLRSQFRRVRYAMNNLRPAFDNACRYNISYRIRYLESAIQSSYRRLSYAVMGGSYPFDRNDLTE